MVRGIGSHHAIIQNSIGKPSASVNWLTSQQAAYLDLGWLSHMTESHTELQQKLGNLHEIGWREMTVAELASHLAGLPPMMEVFTDSDGVAMFVNDTEVQVTAERGVPFLRLKCSVTPKPPDPPSAESVEVQTARKAQVAMDLAHRIDEAGRMPAATVEDPRITYTEDK